MTRNVRAERAHLRAHVYGLLARIVRRPPDRDLVAGLRNPDVFSTLVGVGMDLNRAELLEPPPESVLSTLLEDYRFLFVSPCHRIHLNESIYRRGDGCLMGESTAQVRRFIRSRGLEIDSAWTGLPDHLAVELEILQRMTDAEARLWDADDHVRAGLWRHHQRTFLEDHVSRWVTPVWNAVAIRARTVFYGEIARLAATFLREERRCLADRRPGNLPRAKRVPIPVRSSERSTNPRGTGWLSEF